MGSTPRWELPDQVRAEVKKAKLSLDEATRLSDLMERFAQGRTFRKDHKRLRDGVEELRLDGNHRIFRLYFGRTEGGLVLLGLHFDGKKKNVADRAIDVAADRLRRRETK